MGVLHVLSFSLCAYLDSWQVNGEIGWCTLSGPITYVCDDIGAEEPSGPYTMNRGICASCMLLCHGGGSYLMDMMGDGVISKMM